MSVKIEKFCGGLDAECWNARPFLQPALPLSERRGADGVYLDEHPPRSMNSLENKEVWFDFEGI